MAELVVPQGDGLEGLGDHEELAVDLRALDRDLVEALELAVERGREVGEDAGVGLREQAVVRGDEHVGAAAGGDVRRPLGEDVGERLLDDVDLEVRVRGQDRAQRLLEGAGLAAARTVAVPHRDLAGQRGRGLARRGLGAGRGGLGRSSALRSGARRRGGRAAAATRGGDDRSARKERCESKLLLHPGLALLQRIDAWVGRPAVPAGLSGRARPWGPKSAFDVPRDVIRAWHAGRTLASARRPSNRQSRPRRTSCRRRGAGPVDPRTMSRVSSRICSGR